MEENYMKSDHKHLDSSLITVFTNALRTQHQKITGNNLDAKISAVFELGCMGKAAACELDNLIALSDHDDPVLRATSISSIGRINTFPEKSIPILCKALLDNDIQVRQFAAAGIGMFEAEELKQFDAIHYLEKAITDLDFCVQDFAREALYRIKYQHKPKLLQ